MIHLEVTHTFCSKCNKMTRVGRNYQGHYFCAECNQITSFWMGDGYPQKWNDEGTKLITVRVEPT